MKSLHRTTGIITCLTIAGLASSAEAQLSQRHSVVERGGMRVIGSTLGHDCANSVDEPAAAEVNCGLVLNPNDTAPDIYYRDNQANTLITGNEARTSAHLTVPANATVSYARLYWSSRRGILAADQQVVIAFNANTTLSVNADDSVVLDGGGGDGIYQSTANVTNFVSANGSGEYSVTNVDAVTLSSIDLNEVWSGWTLVVIYSAPDGVFATRTLYDGFVPVVNTTATTPVNITIPDSPTHVTTLGLWVYEGDFDDAGDSLTFDGSSIFDANNPVDNVFNSSSTRFGALITAGTPALSGEPDSMASYDLDLFDASSLVQPLQSNMVDVSISTTTDTVYWGGMVLEMQGCATSAGCTDGATPACNPDNGNCQPCVVGGDQGICTTSPDGPICMDDGTGGQTCGCTQDPDCGNQFSGMVCDLGVTDKCIEGCRGQGFGNQCMPGFYCTSDDQTIGECLPNCEDDSDCVGNPNGEHCETNSGMCEECVLDEHCELGEICDPDDYTCTDDPGSGGGGASSGSAQGGSGGSSGTSSAMGGASSGTSSAMGGASSGTSSAMGGASSGVAQGGASTGTSSAQGGVGANGFDDALLGGGCSCRTEGGNDADAPIWLALAGLALLGVRRRQSR